MFHLSLPDVIMGRKYEYDAVVCVLLQEIGEGRWQVFCLLGGSSCQVLQYENT
jgi:hypothetical protein